MAVHCLVAKPMLPLSAPFRSILKVNIELHISLYGRPVLHHADTHLILFSHKQTEGHRKVCYHVGLAG